MAVNWQIRLSALSGRQRARARRIRRVISIGPAPPASSPPPGGERLTPDLARIGGEAAYLLSADSSQYIRRNVETIEVKTASFARRRLTVDVQLPCDPTLGEVGADGVHTYWIPVASIAKHPPRSNIDLRDDHGRVVALLTREENAAISLAAVRRAVRDLLDADPPPTLADALRLLVEGDGLRGDLPFALARVGLEKAGADLDSGAGLALAESLRVLAGNSLIWVALQGSPGQRRVIKFHYDIELERAPLRRARPGTRQYLVYATEAQIVIPLDVPVRGDGNPYSPLRRLAARIALAVGLGAIDLGIESPYLTASSAYHLQVESPPGVETRDVRLLTKLAEHSHQDSWQREHGVHLYVAHARLAEDGGSALANVALRVGRRGFMTFSWLSAVLTAALLWAVTIADRVKSEEATAAVLLVGPALLAALVVRPGEHPVATKLLSGVRTLVAVNGLLAIAAAAAVAGAKPSALSLDHTWRAYAIAAAAIAALVTLSWIFSWDTSDALTKSLRRRWLSESSYRATCLGLVAIAAALLTLGSGLLFQRPDASLWIYCGALVLLALHAALAMASYARLDLPPSATPSWCAVLLLTYYAPLAAAVLAMHQIRGWGWEEVWRWVALLPLLSRRCSSSKPCTNGSGLPPRRRASPIRPTILQASLRRETNERGGGSLIRPPAAARMPWSPTKGALLACPGCQSSLEKRLRARSG